jgi:uncharacterized protein (UPF0264 family)
LAPAIASRFFQDASKGTLMTKLLVSVRSPAEAEIARDEGVDLVDVKEPSRGSLGAADLATLAAIVRRLDRQVPLSAALGELLEGKSLPRSLAHQLLYAKFGLAGCATQVDWAHRWEQAIAALPPGVLPAAVAYADWRAAGAPEPWTVLAEATRLGCDAILLDTWDKSQGALTGHVDIGELGRFVAVSHAAGLRIAVAGSLDWNHFEMVLALAPDYLAVRGSVCVGDREGQLDRTLVRRLARLVHQGARHASATAPTKAVVPRAPTAPTALP